MTRPEKNIVKIMIIKNFDKYSSFFQRIYKNISYECRYSQIHMKKYNGKKKYFFFSAKKTMFPFLIFRTMGCV